LYVDLLAESENINQVDINTKIRRYEDEKVSHSMIALLFFRSIRFLIENSQFGYVVSLSSLGLWFFGQSKLYIIGIM